MDNTAQQISVRYAAPGTYLSTVPATLWIGNQRLKLSVTSTPPGTETVALDIAFSQINKAALLRGSLTLWVDGKKYVITPEGTNHQDTQISLNLLSQFREAGVKVAHNSKRLLIFWLITVLIVIIVIAVSNH